MASPMQPMVPVGYKRRSFFGPVILISIGVIALLLNIGVITVKSAFVGFAKYWPLLIIVWGIVKLFEYMQAKSQGLPAPGIGAGGIIVLILLCVFGLSASGAYQVSQRVDHDRMQEWFGEDFEMSGFWGKRFEFSETLDADLPTNGRVVVNLERGSITLTPSSDNKVHIAIAKKVYANSEGEAQTLNGKMKALASLSGDMLTIDATRKSDWSGTADLTIAVPAKAPVELVTVRGDVVVRDRQANVKAKTSRGDVTLDNITGNAEVGLGRRGFRRGDLLIRKVTGDVRTDGEADDVEVADVSGRVELNTALYGELKVARVGGGLHFKSTRTDLETGKLAGNLRLAHGDLDIDQVTGPIALTTRSKDIRVEDFTGALRIENRNGEVTLRPALPLSSINVENDKGSIRLLLPPNASFNIDAVARRGEIDSEFDLTRTEERREQRASGKVNKGGPRISVNTEHGAISILRSDSSRAADLRGDQDDEDAREHDAEARARDAERRVQEKMKKVEERMKEKEKEIREKIEDRF